MNRGGKERRKKGETGRGREQRREEEKKEGRKGGRREGRWGLKGGKKEEGEEIERTEE